MTDPHQLTDAAQLNELLGEPLDYVVQKIGSQLDEPGTEFIQRSPLLIMATTDENGGIDTSPKGDAAGFVLVEGPNELLIPDRPGNRLAFGFRNIIQTGKVSLIFVIPRMRETYRVNGTATLTRDPQLLQRLAAQGKPAVLCTRVHIEQCFFHCGKAMIRSKLWQPDSWEDKQPALMKRQFVDKMGGSDEVEELFDAAMEEAYTNDLY
jgi:PPOX class probable FMN-dependent enzyme